MKGIFILGFTLLSGFNALAGTLYVKAGTHLQSVIDRAEHGDTLILESGVYVGNLIIEKKLHILSPEKPYRAHIVGNNDNHTIFVNHSEATLENLVIKNSGDDLAKKQSCIFINKGAQNVTVAHSDLSWCLFGIYIEFADHAKILNNVITGKRALTSVKRGNGLQLYGSHHAQIIGNNISFVRDAIYVDVSNDARFERNKLHHARYGTHYMNAYRNVWEHNETYLNRGGLALMEVKNQTVRHNKAWGNSDHGIMLRTIQDSVIEHNIVAGNARGFFIYDAEYNTLAHNLIAGNKIGIHIAAGSKNNDVNANDFVHNQLQIKFVATRDEHWGKKIGNYWSNYSGWDHDANGIGDTEYEASDTMDRLSWQYPEIKLLLASPSIASLRLAARQFPLLRSPSVVDERPSMKPFHSEWSLWLNEAYQWPSH